MTQGIVSCDDFIIKLYCILDDLHRLLERGLLGKKEGRKSVLSDSECMAIAILRWKVGSLSWKSFYREVLPWYRWCFPVLPEYKNFIIHIHRVTPLIAKLIPFLLQVAKDQSEHSIYFIDSTPIPVCTTRRIDSNRTGAGLASRGKHSLGWFYGFKLHAVCDTEGRLVAVTVTTGSTHDSVPVLDLVKDLSGVLVGDAAYLSEKLRTELQAMGVYLQAAPRKNMRKVMTRLQGFLFRQRQAIERVFASIKYRFHLDLSLARSIDGMLALITTALFFYQIKTTILPVS